MGDDDTAVLCTERLRLRPWTTSAADLARLSDIYGRDEVTRWLGGPPTLTPAEIVARWTAVHDLDRRFGCRAIELADGSVAGTVLFKPLPNGVGEVEVGWHLHPDSWGHGYATEPSASSIARQPNRWSRSWTAVHRATISAGVRVGGPPSQRVTSSRP